MKKINYKATESKRYIDSLSGNLGNISSLANNFANVRKPGNFNDNTLIDTSNLLKICYNDISKVVQQIDDDSNQFNKISDIINNDIINIDTMAFKVRNRI